MIDKIIDVLGYMLIGFLIVYAICFYATELIRIISWICSRCIDLHSDYANMKGIRDITKTLVGENKMLTEILIIIVTWVGVVLFLNTLNRISKYLLEN